MSCSTLYEIIQQNVTASPDARAVALPAEELELSFSEFASKISELKNVLLSNGIGEGACVALAAPNGLAYLTSFLAITWTRAIAAPLNPAYKVEEFSFYLTDTEAKGVIVDATYPADHHLRTAAANLSIPVWEISQSGKTLTLTKLEGHSAVDEGKLEEFAAIVPTPGDVALFLHTSGTTSAPKGVPLTHGNLTVSLSNIAGTYDLSPADSSYIVMPLFHVHGLLGATLSSLKSGGSVIIPPRFSASSFWEHITKYRATWYSAVPTIHQIMLIRAEQTPPPDAGLRFIRSCSSSLAPVTLEKLESTFKAPVLEAYGMTEASHQMCSNPLPSKGTRRAGTVGNPTNVEVAIMDDDGKKLPDGTRGEVCIRGLNVTLGYHNNPAANAANFTADGWFRTGDQGVMEDNFLTLTGRLKELINRGGEKISPVELDSVLLEHPNVKDGVAFGGPDEKYGEKDILTLAIAKAEGLTEESILEFLRPKVASFKLPSKIFIADTLPRTATGKIQRRHVATHFLK